MFLRYIKNAYAVRLERPTRPRILNLLAQLLPVLRRRRTAEDALAGVLDCKHKLTADFLQPIRGAKLDVVVLRQVTFPVAVLAVAESNADVHFCFITLMFLHAPCPSGAKQW